MVAETKGHSSEKKVRVLAVDDVPDGEARQVTIEDQKIAIVRIHDQMYAIGDMCSHANYSLSEGPVDTTDVTIECWKHGAQFSLCDGKPVSLPATQPVPVFNVEIDKGEVYVLIPESQDS